ncbi:MAG TPA: hypothetical protein VNP04_13440 [Alphaproteobacteria bacterium]|nr:hypothetical protein [Alphaproteobacteria bacterium]
MRPASNLRLPIANRLLAHFPAREFVQLLLHVETVALRQQEALYEADRRISYIHFPRSGVVSLLINLPGGSMVEVALVGREGMLGGSRLPYASHYYRLPLRFEELVVVTERFHLKPLLPLLTGDGSFYVLALSQNAVRLLQCTRHHVSEVDLENVPTSLDEALKYDDPERQLQFHTGTPPGTGRRPAMFHGHGVGIDDSKDNILRYCQQLDAGLRTLLRGEQAPLVLAAVDYLMPIYREANTYGHLLNDGVSGNPEGLSAEELQAQAWQVVEPHFRQAQEDAVRQYHRLAGTGRTANDIREVLPAAAHGRVECLFVAVGVQQWGTYDRNSEALQVHQEPQPGDEDLLDLAAMLTIANGGSVHAVKPDDVPGKAPLAAIYRY